MTDNPWVEAHVEAEAELQGGGARGWRLARSVVAAEYDFAPNQVRCPHCGATAHYKATIGAMKCPTCGGLAHTNGSPIGGQR